MLGTVLQNGHSCGLGSEQRDSGHLLQTNCEEKMEQAEVRRCPSLYQEDLLPSLPVFTPSGESWGKNYLPQEWRIKQGLSK